jgi:methylmalonyl-CoA/ethylmalonyl-CoA epimerase
MISKINHIGIAVKSLDEHIPFYRDILQLEFEGREDVQEQKVKIAMFKVGEVRIELLEPTSDASAIAKFIAKKGEGMHHIAYHTDDIENEIRNAEENGIKMIDKEPRNGAHNTKIAFMHPKFTGKVLTEICQKK